MNVTFEQGAFEDFTDWATEDKKLYDKKWIAVAQERLQQLRAGEVTAQPANEVFKKITARFQQ